MIVILLLPLLLLSLCISALVILFAGKQKRAAVTRFIALSYAVGAGFMALVVVAGWIHYLITSPMSVERQDVIGTYHIDRDMFAGPAAEWQHDHFTLEITASDSVVLRSQDLHGHWHSFARSITPVQGVYSYLWKFPVEGDSTAHHILANTPTLHRQQWSFYYAFRSPRFGNVFFRKDD